MARVGSRMELWDTLVQVQLCHPLDPGDGNTSIGVTLGLGFSRFCLTQFDLAAGFNRNTNLVSPVSISGPHKNVFSHASEKLSEIFIFKFVFVDSLSRI